MEVKFDEKGLIPAIAQDINSGEILMQAFMNKEALDKTIETGFVHYFSRSRNCLWKKGDTSGHLQRVCEIYTDCDSDSILIKVIQEGTACHTGKRSCFYTKAYAVDADVTGLTSDNTVTMLKDLYAVITDRRDHPKEGSYTNYLFDKGIDKILKKVGEECAEVIIAAKNRDAKEISYEVADLMYHLTVMLVENGLSWNDIAGELSKR